MSIRSVLCHLCVAGMFGAVLVKTPATAADTNGYAAMVELFEDWRAFERPTMHGNVPDYSAQALERKKAGLPDYIQRLEAIDTDGWPQDNLTDYRLVMAEMNGLDFNLRVLRPWARDPSFYVSVWASRTDVPLREGPASYPEIELYNYRYPLSRDDQRELTFRIGAIPALLEQARENLKDSNARDLWVYGGQSLRTQIETLSRLEAGTLQVSSLDGRKVADMSGANAALRTAILDAREATEAFVGWLEQLAPTKTGPSGVGKENYTWYLRNVHLLPYSWEEEVTLLRRELERAHASLRLEEHNNRNLPPLEPAADAGSFDKLATERLDKFIAFLVTEDIIPDKPYIQSALAPRKGRFVPAEKRAFFAQVTHREPMLLYSHDYHWIDLARMRAEPHPRQIRRMPSLSNIWDSRAEGVATAFEEVLMHAGLYDDNPRAKELVWIMLANRAARGLASLYVQANELDLEQAGQFQAEWTPRGWSRAGDELTAFEQLLYLRQPGYGTSYIVGKILFDRLIATYAHKQDLAGEAFVLKDLMGQFNDEGMIPTALIEQELVGK